MTDKVRTRNWRDVRKDAERAGKIDPKRVAAIKADLLDQLAAYRLAEIRKELSMTQMEIADALAVGQSAISKLEAGDLRRSSLGTISDYVEALGGKLRVIADFDDVQMTVK
jgi:DNA-binding XRE family transcriptional regulator